MKFKTDLGIMDFERSGPYLWNITIQGYESIFKGQAKAKAIKSLLKKTRRGKRR